MELTEIEKQAVLGLGPRLNEILQAKAELDLAAAALYRSIAERLGLPPDAFSTTHAVQMPAGQVIEQPAGPHAVDEAA